MDSLPSKLLQNAVDEMSSLPGVGKKTALRLVLNLLKREKQEVRNFAAVFVALREEICFCNSCYNLSDHEVCSICLDQRRDKQIICVVEDIRDIIAIENTQQYKGVYHVLGGVISPIDGIGPSDLKIEELVERLSKGEVKELILALPPTMEGDTTNFFLYRRLKEFQLVFSTIARGVSVGGELEYADEVTLGRSIVNRMPLEQLMNIRK